MKVLALHGKGGSGGSLAARLAPVVDRVSLEIPCASFAFPDAPLQGRAWWHQDPAGSRSFTADQFLGVGDSLAAVVAAADGTPFDAVIGHSQGAMFAAILLAQRRERSGRARKILHAEAPAILSGAAWPKPYADLLNRAAKATRPFPQTLHFVSSKDDINPPEMGRRICEVFSPSSQLHVHDEGHVIPLDEESLDLMVRVLVEETGRPSSTKQPANTRRSLDGLRLEDLLAHMVQEHGFSALAEALPIRCFEHDPSISSSIRFLRKPEHEWARRKLEALYLRGLR